jgi:hypothetical protein
MFQLSNAPVPEETVTQHRRRWSIEEDDYLREQVARCGEYSVYSYYFRTDIFAEESAKSIDWTRVSRGLNRRSNKDCRKRWLKIDPKWNQGAWSVDEDDRLKKGVDQWQTRYVSIDSYYY